MTLNPVWKNFRRRRTLLLVGGVAIFLIAGVLFKVDLPGLTWALMTASLAVAFLLSVYLWVLLGRLDRLKQAMETRSAALEKMAALGQLLSGTAHELNNPLTSIIGYSDLLLMSPDLPAKVREDLDTIRAEAKRCAAIVQNLSAFSRKRGPKREPCDINRLISETLKLRAYQMSVDNIILETRLDPDLPQTMADSHQLQQVFLNIVNNAMQAMSASVAGHGRPNAERDMDVKRSVAGHGRLTASTQLRNETIWILFQDTGPGISEEHLGKIFDPFFTTKEVGSGVGLGLSVCHGIIADHGGKILAESSPGNGAAFVIELPLIQPSPIYALTDGIESGAVLQGGGRCVLVVDDEPVVREVLSRVIRKWDFSVTAAAGVDEAIERIGQTSFEVILSDHKMPGKDGEDFYEWVKSRRPDLLDRFILMTGDILAPSTERFLQKTAITHVEKPLDFDRLKQIIGGMIRARPAKKA